MWASGPRFLSFLSEAFVLLSRGVGLYPGVIRSETRASEDWPCMTLLGACDKQTYLLALRLMHPKCQG